MNKNRIILISVAAAACASFLIFTSWRQEKPKSISQAIDPISNDNPPAEVVVNAAAAAIKGELQTLYHVKTGDSLYSIAKKHNVSVKAIKDANRDTNNLLAVGEIIVIPTKP